MFTKNSLESLKGEIYFVKMKSRHLKAIVQNFFLGHSQNQPREWQVNTPFQVNTLVLYWSNNTEYFRVNPHNYPQFPSGFHGGALPIRASGPEAGVVTAPWPHMRKAGFAAMHLGARTEKRPYHRISPSHRPAAMSATPPHAAYPPLISHPAIRVAFSSRQNTHTHAQNLPWMRMCAN